jgi:hypothetical protein
MYQFSRSLYREMAHQVVPGRGEDVSVTRQRFLRACERSMERLATDRYYFAKPVKTLFNDVRHFFPIGEQLRVYRACETTMALAGEYVDSQMREGVTFDGSPVCCHATTRRGGACRRVPLPGREYCPSHKHLEEGAAAAA